jgi:hypothetical protein
MLPLASYGMPDVVNHWVMNDTEVLVATWFIAGPPERPERPNRLFADQALVLGYIDTVLVWQAVRI